MKGKLLIAITTICAIALLASNVYICMKVSKLTANTNTSTAGNSTATSIEAGNKEDVQDAVSKEYIKSFFGDDGEGTLAMLRDTFTDSVVYYDGKYRFVDVDASLASNELKSECFGKDSKNFITYEEDGKVTSRKGIDVSVYQGDIDWEKVAADGIEYAIIRVGYRGYGTGKLVEDEKAKENLKGANAAGIKVGVYFFSQAISEKEAVEEAEFVHKIIKKYKIDYPVVFDTEEISGDTARSEELTAEERTDIAVAFCDKVEELGYTPMVYANIKWFTTALSMERLEKYDKWYANYDSKLYFPYKICMWQYSDAGVVDGINGKVDMNICFGEY